MPHQRAKKFLEDGTINPKWKPRKSYHAKKFLEDGSINPKWKPRKKGPGSKSGPSGKNLSKFQRAAFIGWDGEGITLPDGRHVYALLANSLGHYIMNPNGLGTEECLEFIANELKAYPKAIHCGFVFSYDTAMMLFSELDYDTVSDIWEGGRHGVKLHGENGVYSISYRPRKSLQVKRWNDPPFVEKVIKGESKYVPSYDCSGTIWDVFGFFQGSFVSAIEKWLGKNHPKLEQIKNGKLHRGTFTEAMLRDEVLPYCLSEVEVLVELMGVLAKYLKEADLKLSRWDGAGAVAAGLLKKYGIRDHMAELPPNVQDGAQYAYFGGRIEICKYGHYDGRVYHYDINSAYPSVQRTCPSLANGTWREIEAPSDLSVLPPFTLCHVRWRLSSDDIEGFSPWSFFPFPYRERGGTVIFPYEGEGYYWLPEVSAAVEALPFYIERFSGASLDILGCYAFYPHQPGYSPFTFIDDLYATRKRWKAEGRGAEKVLKLGINSLYGKTAQHSGYNPERGLKPPYHNLAWAGFITSSTRAKLFSAAMQAPEGILMFATDGIFSTVPLDLPQSDILGDWEDETHDEIVIVQSGVYFYRNGEEWETFCRGFDKEKVRDERTGKVGYALNPGAIIDAWRDRQIETYFPSTRFCGIGTSLASRNAWESRGQWIRVGQFNGLPGRKLSLTTRGTKRAELTNSKNQPLWVKKGVTPNPSNSLIDTFAAFNLAGEMLSEKYALPWDADFELDDMVDGVKESIVNEEHTEGEYM